VLRRAVQLLWILTLNGCGDPVQIDLFAPVPSADAQVDDSTGRVRDAGSKPALRAAPDAQLVRADDADAGDTRDFAEDADDAGTGLGSVVVPASLILRYDFSGSGALLVDRVGARPARALGGARLDGSGALVLDGVDDYVDLPEGTLASLESVTVVAWLVLGEGGCRQPVFGFGERDAPLESADDAPAALAVSLSSCPVEDAGVEPPTGGLVSGSFRIVRNRSFQLALSYDAARSLKTLYVNGVRVSEGPIRYSLAELGNAAWLGRQPARQDAFARASYDEFRVYDGALTRAQVFELHARGPDLP